MRNYSNIFSVYSPNIKVSNTLKSLTSKKTIRYSLLATTMLLPSLVSAKIINGNNGNNWLFGSRKDDEINGFGGHDWIYAGRGNDLISAGSGNDRVYAGKGNDDVSGGNGKDKLYGGKGNDTLNGDAGNDKLYGGSGNDILIGGAGADVINGGRGNDTASYVGSSAGVTIDLANNIATGGDAQGDKLFKIENITGSDHNDVLTGNAKANVIDGGNGDDTISGGGGADTIDGGDGHDTIIGGSGVDTLIGGFGENTFIINQGDNSETQDIIIGGLLLDTLEINSASTVTAFEVDLDDLNVFDIDQIELDNGRSESVSLTIDTATSFKDTNGLLRISADQYDIISTTSEWNFSGVLLGHDEVYYRYSALDSSDNFQQVSVSMEAGSLVGFAAPTITGYTETISNNFVADDDGDSALSLGYSAQNLTVTTGIGRAYIATGDGDDYIDASAAARSNIATGAGDDTVIGGAGRDFFRSSEGSDTYDGGGSSDRMSYYRSTEGVNVNLTTDVNSGGHAEGDTLIGMEEINGSIFDDILVGDENDNNLAGETGDDVIMGMGGNDSITAGYGLEVIDGGTGDDRITFGQRFGSTDGTYDGGDDFDTLEFIASNNVPGIWNLDFSELNIANVEKIQFYGGAGDQRINVDITAQDIMDMTDGDNELIFAGDIHDTITSTGEGWVQGADQIIDSETYNSYSTGGTTLLIDEDIVQTIS